jgi:hypothetical protein
MKKLSTEAQLSALFDLDPDIPLEDAVVKSYQTARVSGTLPEVTGPELNVQPAIPPVEFVNIVNPPVFARIFNPPVATSPDIFCQQVHQNAPVTDLDGDLLNGPDYEIQTKFPFGTSPQEGDADDTKMAGYGLKRRAIDEPVHIAQVLAEDAMLAKDGTLKRTEDSSDSSDESSELCEKCDEIIAIGDEINYYHFMVVMGTPGAMSTGKVTSIDPDNEYMISTCTGDLIPRGSLIRRVREPNSSGDLVAISGKRYWRSCESYQCKAALDDNALSNALYAKSARLSGVFHAITDSLVQSGVPRDLFREFSGPVTTNMLVESPDNVGLVEDDSWNGLFSSLKFDFQCDANPRMLWLYTISLSSKVTTKEELLRAPLRSRFAVVTRKEVTEPWIRVILEKVRSMTWDVLNEMGDDQLMTVDCTEDNGPIAEWDMLYQSPAERDIRDAVRESQKNLQDQVATDNRIEESPRRKTARYDACISQKRGGRQMKAMASKVNGGEIEVGCVVQVTLKNMDSTKGSRERAVDQIREGVRDVSVSRV